MQQANRKALEPTHQFIPVNASARRPENAERPEGVA